MANRIAIPCLVACAVLAWAAPSWASYRSTPGPTLPEANAEMAATVAPNGEVWLAGGYNSSKTVLRWMPGTSTWTVGPSVPATSRNGWLFARPDGTLVYVTPNSTVTAVSNATLDGWTTLSLPVTPRAAAMVPAGDVVACSSSNCYRQSGSTAWTAISALPYTLGELQLVGQANGVVAFGNRSYTVSVTCSNGQSGCTEWRYEHYVARLPLWSSWSGVGSVSSTRGEYYAVGTNDGYVVESTGLSKYDYHVWSSSFSRTTGSLPEAMRWPGLVALRNGGVLHIGGGDNQMYGRNPIWRIDPASGTATVQVPLSTGRTLAASVLLKDGRVLVVGGVGPSGNVLATTEILAPQSCTGEVDCLASEDCLHGYCVDAGCSGACVRGDVPGAAGLCTPGPKGSVPASSCGNYLCNGTLLGCPTRCTSAADCTSGNVCLNNACVPGKALGQTCGASAECLSGNCVDGVCCNTSCAGSCDACNLAGSVGTCSPRPDGYTGSCGLYACDGTNASCPTTCASNADCVSTHYCINSSCKPGRPNGYDCTAGAQCDSFLCVDGVCCGDACDGCERCNRADAKGICTIAEAGDPGRCAPYVCDGASELCGSVCDSTADCVAGYYCDPGGSDCQPKRANGASCDRGEQCANGSCVDGVCCESSCAGGCDRCNLPGLLGFCRPAAAGTAGSCGAYRCDGAASCPTSCDADADCAADHACVGGTCRPGLAMGASCSDGASCASGFCADGVCCSTSCDGACDRCDEVVGHCTPRAARDPGVPSCAAYRCDGASGACPATCSDASACSAGFSCTAGQCVAATPQGHLCSTSAQCLSGSCVDGVCCNGACGGSCEACNVPGRVGTCAPVAAGSVEAACGTLVCDGTQRSCPAGCGADAGCRAGFFCEAGACRATKVLGLACERGGECGTGFCVDGVCCDGACTAACESCRTGGPGRCAPELALAVNSVACAPYVCDGSGRTCPATCRDDAGCFDGSFCSAGSCVPKHAAGSACVAARECASGFCSDGVCCDGACSGACDRCNIPGKSGTCSTVPPGEAGSPSCSPFLCSGISGTCPVACADDSQCVAGRFCQGGRCLDRKLNGVACNETRECASGFCSDGVCCDGACTGSCQTCAGGACRPVAGAPPANRAACVGSGACGGRCNGASPDCVYPATTTVCRPGLCTDGLASPEGRCDGAGACPAATTVDCEPFACGEGSCVERCGSDAECSPGHGCVEGSCVGQRADGEACRVDAQCASGACADGVCCDRACGGGCERCDLAGSVGACSFVETPGDATCAPYRCAGGEGSCPSGCASDADCLEGHACDARGRCTPRAGNGAACAANDECVSGVCADGVCCDRACDGACESCGRGVCTVVHGEPVDGRCGGSGVCAGRCDGVSPGCVFPTASCGPAFCAQGFAFAEARCDGAGACAPGAADQCFAGCDGTTCAEATPVSEGCASTGVVGLGALAGLLARRRRGRTRLPAGDCS